MSQLAGVLERLFDQAERISLQGWHYSRSDNPEAHSLHPPRDVMGAEGAARDATVADRDEVIAEPE